MDVAGILGLGIMIFAILILLEVGIAALAFRFITKKVWKQCFVFGAWVVGIGALAGFANGLLGLIIPGFLLGLIVYLLLGHYKFGLDWFSALKVYGISVVLGIIIALLLIAVFAVTLTSMSLV